MMDRITNRDVFIGIYTTEDVYAVGEDDPSVETAWVGTPIDRLAAYEDTGLMPEEIEQIKKNYVDAGAMYSQLAHQYEDKIASIQAELDRVKAEKDAAVSDMAIIGNADKYDYVGGCYVCKHNERNFDNFGHSGCDYNNCKFEWRGLEATTCD